MKKRFEEIYFTNEWLYGSGEGSLPANTIGYRRFLESFMKRFQVRSVIDLGCGDWQFSRLIDWSAVEYDGYEIVADLVTINNLRFGTPKTRFHVAPDDWSDLPSAQLLIVKDVLQHWSERSILEFLPHLRRFEHCLITNCVNPRGPTSNHDIPDGGFRWLDLRLPPFSCTAIEEYVFTSKDLSPGGLGAPRWSKAVLHLLGRR